MFKAGLIRRLLDVNAVFRRQPEAVADMRARQPHRLRANAFSLKITSHFRGRPWWTMRQFQKRKML